MRLEIYELALLDFEPAFSNLSLLQTCRQISMEAQPTLYKRPTSFSSQAKLFSWIERSRKQDLKRVRTLTLRLTDINLSPVLNASSSPGAKPRPSIWTLYQNELERLDEAWKALSNLSSLTIVPPKSGRSQLLKGLYHSFLGLTPKRLPKLKHLELQDGNDILDIVPALKEISDVKCTAEPSRSDASTRKGWEGSPDSKTVQSSQILTGSPKDREASPKETAGSSPSTDNSRQDRKPPLAEEDDVVGLGDMEGILKMSEQKVSPVHSEDGRPRAIVYKPISQRKSKQARGGATQR